MAHQCQRVVGLPGGKRRDVDRVFIGDTETEYRIVYDSFLAWVNSMPREREGADGDAGGWEPLFVEPLFVTYHRDAEFLGITCGRTQKSPREPPPER